LVTGSLGDAELVSSGLEHTCATVAGGELYCWGSNVNQQLGAEEPVSGGFSPTRVDLGGQGAVALAVGPLHTCALVGTAPTLLCWGDNLYGQLGSGRSWIESPVDVDLP
jgi:alpha-tubulin suppressor-like RCC1 family protein